MRKKIFLITLFTGFMLVSQIGMFVNVSAEGIRTIQPKTISGTLGSQFGNDVFWTVGDGWDMMNSRFWSTTSNWQHEHAAINNHVVSVTVGQNVFYNIPNKTPDYMHRANNLTNTEGMKLSYQGEYYDLTTGGSNGMVYNISNLAVISGENYGFRFEAVENQPIVFHVETQNSFWISWNFVSPSGVAVAENEWYSAETPEFTPFVPYENGTYMAYLTPQSDGVISNLELVSDFNIKDISNSHFESFTTYNSSVAWFRIPKTESNDTSEFIVRDFNSDSRCLWGSCNYELTFFNMHGTDSFGRTNNLFVLTDEETLVAVTTNLWRETPASKILREHRTLPEGLSFEVDIWSDDYNMMDLPVNQDFQTLPEGIGGQSGWNYYTYINDQEDLIVGLNGSLSNVNFFNMDTGETVSVNTNLFTGNGNDKSLDMLPMGRYVVAIQTYQTIRLTEVVYRLPTGNQWNVQSTMNTPIILYQPRGDFSNFVYNVTYLDKLNMSINLDMTVYDGMGNRMNDHDSLFSHVFNNVSTFMAGGAYGVQNNTVISNYDNYDGLFIRVSQLGNQLMNSSILVPDADILSVNELDHSASFLFEIVDNLDFLGEQDPLAYYARHSFDATNGGEFDLWLNASKTSSNSIWLDMTFESGFAYYFNISGNWTTNTFGIQNEYWTMFSARINFVDDIDLFTKMLTVGSEERFGAIITFNNPFNSANGTFTIKVSKIVPMALAGITYGFLGINNVTEIQDINFEVASTDFTVIAGILLGTVLVATIVFLLYKRFRAL